MVTTLEFFALKGREEETRLSVTYVGLTKKLGDFIRIKQTVSITETLWVSLSINT